jgi:fumarate reductase flavoprotein subunit
VGAVRFKDAKYWIDPEKCVECGMCAKNCHNGIITKIGAPAPQVEPHDPIRKQADLVVVGAGGSGMVCAVKFAQSTGKKVIVLEKAKEIGGNTWFASGFRVHYSDLQRKAGAPDNREQEIREFLMGTLQQEDPQLVHNVFYATEHFIDWLMADCGCAEDFTLKQTPHGMAVELDNKTGTKYKRIDCSIGPGGAGSFVIEKMAKQAKELGIEILTQCGAEKLVQDETGAVTGVIASDPGGIVEIEAKAVVMATGCFSHNAELVEKCCPGFFDPDCVPVHRFSVPTCTGDGIKMCTEAGADIDYENTQCIVLGPARHPYSFSLVNLIREPQSILVNANGVRFGNEQDNTMGMRKVLAKQPHRFCWAITNDAMLAEQVITNGNSPMGQGEHKEIVSHWKEDLERELAIGAACASADTLEELAAKIDVPADALVETIRTYNQGCKDGFDSAFFKDPRFLFPLEGGPYYALRCQTFQENAVGGMKINSKVQIVKPDGTPIPNLYGVGDNTRGVRLAGDVGPDLVERTITNLTWCMASGYMAAEQVAEALAN